MPATSTTHPSTHPAAGPDRTSVKDPSLRSPEVASGGREGLSGEALRQSLVASQLRGIPSLMHVVLTKHQLCARPCARDGDPKDSNPCPPKLPLRLPWTNIEHPDKWQPGQWRKAGPEHQGMAQGVGWPWYHSERGRNVRECPAAGGGSGHEINETTATGNQLSKTECRRLIPRMGVN